MRTPRQNLENCVNRLLAGPWRFIQLRGANLDAAAIGGDDVDLLGTRQSVEALTLAAFEWVRAGDCHIRIDARNRRKTRLTLISTDGTERLELDLWIELWQIDHRNRALLYEECEPILVDLPAAIRRLPLELEICVYIHHLASKNKDLCGSSATVRLESYLEASRGAGLSVLASELENILLSKTIPAASLERFKAMLTPVIRMPDAGSLRHKVACLRDKFADAWLGAPRKVSMISVMGCDGAGKTTLARSLAEDTQSYCGVLTGKHLYRKSWLYKLTVIFIRPLMFQEREKYDETIAPLVYLRACLGLRIKLLRTPKQIKLIDRSLMDFLMIERKTDRPRFCRSAWLARWFGRRIPIVHCVLPYEKVMERKAEMTLAGHDIYDVAMCRHHSRRAPTDYIVFNNSGTLGESTAALSHIIAWMGKAE